MIYAIIIVTVYALLVFLDILKERHRKRRRHERLWRRYCRQREVERRIEAMERHALIHVLHERTQVVSRN